MAGLARSEEAYERFCDAVDIPLTVLALLWLPVLVIPLVVHLSGSVAATFDAIDYLVWAFFVVEYLIRVYLSPDRRIFVTRHLLDLVVVVVPVLRPLRAMRVMRFLRLGRAGLVLARGLQRSKAILTHKGLHFVLLAVLAILGVGAALEVVFERHAHGATIHNYGQALWWAVVTATTVGYGDSFPTSAAGRGVAVVIMLVGIGFIGVLTATVASFFVQEQADEEKVELMARLDRIEALLVTVAGAGSRPPLNAVEGGLEAAEPAGGAALRRDLR